MNGAAAAIESIRHNPLRRGFKSFFFFVRRMLDYQPALAMWQPGSTKSECRSIEGIARCTIYYWDGQILCLAAWSVWSAAVRSWSWCGRVVRGRVVRRLPEGPQAFWQCLG